MLQAYVSSVSDVSEVCCKCFISMLYAKVDRDIAHAPIAIHVCERIKMPKRGVNWANSKILCNN